MVDPYLAALAIALASYALGGIPTAHLVARGRGINLRERGSGNLGASNAGRSLGKGPALLIALVDIAKGVIPVVATRYLFGLPSWVSMLAGLGAMAGHVFTPWLKPHRGGKGVATGAGVVAVLFPFLIPVGLLVFIAIALSTRYISLASVGTYSLLALAQILMALSGLVPWDAKGMVFLLLLAILVAFTHRSNLLRLAHHQEPKFAFSNSTGSKQDPALNTDRPDGPKDYT